MLACLSLCAAAKQRRLRALLQIPAAKGKLGKRRRRRFCASPQLFLFV
jgi:hypothetical protein